MRATGYDDAQIIDALCDGSALANFGLGDSDQLDIETAVAELRDTL